MSPTSYHCSTPRYKHSLYAGMEVRQRYKNCTANPWRCSYVQTRQGLGSTEVGSDRKRNSRWCCVDSIDSGDQETGDAGDDDSDEGSPHGEWTHSNIRNDTAVQQYAPQEHIPANPEQRYGARAGGRRDPVSGDAESDVHGGDVARR